MGTRSNIIRANADGSYDVIYCHWDGYPEHNGRILIEHWQDKCKVEELIQLGDISSLSEEIGEKHDFDDRSEAVKKWCNAYGRDRGEKDVSAKHYKNLNALMHSPLEEWIYVYSTKGQWHYTNKPYEPFFKLVKNSLLTTEAIRKQEENA